MVPALIRHLSFLGITLAYLLIITESLATLVDLPLGSWARIVGSTMLFLFLMYKFYPDIFRK